ncbi:hypothetical protein [Cognatishimia sp. F0-27]|uniref:hypothetical protein n=1 Tax=Cognatishimia sp. F0-27 TaxID=2816855 RepID=UPI001D0C2AC3|nr:hypothetical protein [Cognatishimia sp. F0-27]MCC1491661.1 hypothetical protein [Cognatishimia sp. F0-27]
MKLQSFALFAFMAGALAACSGQQVAETALDVTVAAGKIVVNTGVGATKLAARGGAAGYRAVRDARNPEGQPFPEGAVLCSRGEGVFVAARQQEDGSFTCPSA